MTRLPSAFLTAPIAHRGLHNLPAGTPENSLSSFDAAIARGFGIELDLQLSKDGVAMVFHDYSLRRLTDAQGPVATRTAEELTQIPLKGGNGETIPTLAQTLAHVAGRAPLLIELKDQDGALGPNVGPLEEATARTLEGYAGPAALMSFNPHSTARMGELAPHLPRGLVTCDFAADDWPVPEARLAELRDIPDYARTSSAFLSHYVEDLARPRVAALKAAGADILCWTVRSQEVADAAAAIAQNITFEGYLPA